MRPTVLSRSLVSVTAVVATAAGSLAGASAGFAASDSAPQQTATAEAAAPLSVVTVGLNTTRTKGVQRALQAA